MDKIDQSRSQLDQLCAHFDLSHEPFAPSSSFFFSGGQRGHTLETLRHLAIFGDQVLFLTGEKGAGKTKVIEEFIRRHADEVDVVSLAARAGKSGETTIQRFAALSDLPEIKGESVRQTLLRLVETFDQAFLSSGRRTLLVIDDADLLPKEELRLYVTVFRDLPPETGVVLLLAGSEELLAAAAAGSNISRDEWFHQIQLKPLNPEEVMGYLQGWLEASGYQGHLNLGESQAEHLVEIGRGVPGLINRLFPGMVLGARIPEPVQKARVNISPQAVVGILSGLFLLCFAIVAYQYGFFSDTDSVKTPETVTGVVVGEVDEVDAVDVEQEPVAEVAESRLQSIDAALQALEREEPEVAEADVETQDNLPAMSEQAWVEQQDAVAQQEASRQEDPAPDVSVKKEEAPMQEVVFQKEPTKPTPVPETPTQAKPVEKETVQEPAVQEAIVRETRNAIQEKPETSQAHIPGGESSAQWVRSQPPKSYSAQVLGSFSEQSVLKFIGSNKDAMKELFYIKTRLKDKDWYVVLYGVYPDKAAANAALAKAPKKIRDQKPWLRSFDGIITSLPKN